MSARLATVLFLLAAAALPLSAQTLELRSGEVVIGRVTGVDDHTLKVDVTFPVMGTRTIARADVAPRSLYAVLAARIDQADAKAHLELARACRELGLSALAIAEAREAARRDPALASTVDKMIPVLRSDIATEILRQAEGDFAEDRIGSARLGSHVVLRDYSDTAAAKGAQQLMQKIAARTGPVPRLATDEEIDAAIKAARRDLERTEKATTTPAHGKMSDQRALQRAISRLEKTWESIGDLVAPLADATPATPTTSVATSADRLSSTQAEVRHRLTAAYLSLGSIYLQRRALPDADEWCNKACALDPENQHLHRLHELILQAKIVDGWGY